MLRELTRRLTYANVMATLAMFVALGGGAYAVATIGAGDIKRNAVRSKHIKPSAVKGKHIKRAAVGSSDIRNNAVTTGALADNAVTTAKIADNAVTTGKIAGEAVTGSAVQDFSLRLRDLGGETNAGTATVNTTINVPNGGCVSRALTLFNPAPPGVIGSLVLGYLTDSQGGPVLNNVGMVVPTMISETSQGGAIPNLMVCSFGSTQTIPAGSVFQYQLIGP